MSCKIFLIICLCCCSRRLTLRLAWSTTTNSKSLQICQTETHHRRHHQLLFAFVGLPRLRLPPIPRHLPQNRWSPRRGRGPAARQRTRCSRRRHITSCVCSRRRLGSSTTSLLFGGPCWQVIFTKTFERKINNAVFPGLRSVPQDNTRQSQGCESLILVVVRGLKLRIEGTWACGTWILLSFSAALSFLGNVNPSGKCV